VRHSWRSLFRLETSSNFLITPADFPLLFGFAIRPTSSIFWAPTPDPLNLNALAARAD